jgi:hypothetical protein
MTSNEKHKNDLPTDVPLAEAKRDIQAQSQEAVRTGKLKQTDLFLIRPEIARRAVVTLKK